MKSDIKISNEANICNIKEIAKSLTIDEESLGILW